MRYAVKGWWPFYVLAPNQKCSHSQGCQNFPLLMVWACLEGLEGWSPECRIGKTHSSRRRSWVHKFKPRKIGWSQRAEVILSTVYCLLFNVLWIIPCKVVDCFWSLLQLRGSLKKQKKNSNETLVRSGKQKATLFVRVCASRDEGNLLDLRRPLERGTDRLTFQLQMRSWGVETWGSLCTRRSALRKSYLNKLNSSREDRT